MFRRPRFVQYLSMPFFFKHFDAEFPPTGSSLYIEPENPPPSAIPIQWKRMQSFVVEQVTRLWCLIR